MAFGFGMGFPRNETFAGGPSLNLQFAGSQVLPSALSFSRLSNATYFDQTGVLRPAAFNSIRNNTMVGAIAGTPGTAPTNWVAPGAVNGLTQTVVSVGTENGISYIDVRYNGTTSAASAHQVSFEAANFIAAASGQTWSRSVFLKIVAGTTVNLTINNVQQGRDAANTTFTESFQTDITSSLSSTLNRFSTTSTLINASTAFVRSAVNFVYSSGVAIDITLRIGMPQMELGSVATPVIATSGSAAGAPRLDYDPTTLAPLGLLIEEQRTNSVANNTMVGVVAGTPGTGPTDWAVSPSANGITRTIVGTGVENGIAYIEVQYTTGGGTTSASGSFNILPTTTTAVAAASGQTWSASWYLKLQAGSLANFGIGANIAGRDSGGTLLESTTISISPTSAALNTQKYTGSRTLNNASTAFVSTTVFQANYASGVTIDVTLRIGLPQLELGAFPTSVIPTSGTALTRSADVASLNTLSPWFNAIEGTLFAEAQSLRPVADTTRLVAFSDNTANNSIRLNAATTTNAIVTLGATEASYTLSYTIGAVNRWAIAYASNNANGAVNGVTGATDTSVALPTVDRLEIGRLADGASGARLVGYVRRITYYPRRLSNAELQAITA